MCTYARARVSSCLCFVCIHAFMCGGVCVCVRILRCATRGDGHCIVTHTNSALRMCKEVKSTYHTSAHTRTHVRTHQFRHTHVHTHTCTYTCSFASAYTYTHTNTGRSRHDAVVDLEHSLLITLSRLIQTLPRTTGSWRRARQQQML